MEYFSQLYLKLDLYTWLIKGNFLFVSTTRWVRVLRFVVITVLGKLVLIVLIMVLVLVGLVILMVALIMMVAGAVVVLILLLQFCNHLLHSDMCCKGMQLNLKWLISLLSFPGLSERNSRFWIGSQWDTIHRNTLPTIYFNRMVSHTKSSLLRLKWNDLCWAPNTLAQPTWEPPPVSLSAVCHFQQQG